MTKITINNEEITNILNIEKIDFPKYSTQIINLANSNSQATRPKHVGQLSDLIQEFKGTTIKEWEIFYTDKYPNAISDAADKIYSQLKKLSELLGNSNDCGSIDKEMIKLWVYDLIINKTFAGLKFQIAIINKLSSIKNVKGRLATPEEESKGIDGFIGDTAISIKPETYKNKNLNENINCDMVYYKKTKSVIHIFFGF